MAPLALPEPEAPGERVVGERIVHEPPKMASGPGLASGRPGLPHSRRALDPGGAEAAAS